MALIKCPDCGENISSIASACVHCGCSLTVCPDCGTSFAGETDTCLACGFNFKKAKERKSGKAFKGILDYWCANNMGDKLISRLIPIILAIIGVGFIAFMIMSVTNVLRLGYNTDVTKIFKIGVSVNVAVIFSIVFFIMLIAANILHSAFIPYKCGAWIRENEIDVSEFTKQLKELPKSKRTLKNNREIRSAYVAEYPRELSKTVKISAICGIFYIVCFIIASVFLNEGIDAFIVSKAFTDPEASLIGSIDWVLLLIPGIIIALTLAVDILFRVLLRRHVSSWLGYPEVKAADAVITPTTPVTEASSTETSPITVTETETENTTETASITVTEAETENTTETASITVTETETENTTETASITVTETETVSTTETDE